MIPFIASRTLRNRSTGFASATGSGQKTAETWFPKVLRSCAPRMLTGTRARRSGPSDSPFASSQRRSAPATTARMTSLTVPRSARRILRISGRGRSSISNLRWGPIGRFNAEAGASPMPARPRSGFNPPAISRSSLRASLFACSASRTTWMGLVICSLNEVARSSEVFGAGRGFHSAGAAGASVEGSVSISTVARSTPEMPSSMQ